ncbi:unnamed protein product [Arctia plantaginis]|uniref:Uncharacterized protein n=1 Tax=Arctia plantaginis TaxID=874455 RepID=A0A8S0Z587_ARCPL|nr:unnamed protein product [Arctia plantaginis]
MFDVVLCAASSQSCRSVAADSAAAATARAGPPLTSRARLSSGRLAAVRQYVARPRTDDSRLTSCSATIPRDAYLNAIVRI